MPNNQVRDPITDHEVAFAHLILSGTMNDRQAAKAVGFNPDTAANTKSKPRVRDYMLEHRAATHGQNVQQETEELRRLNQSRQRVLARLWDIANMDPERTRSSMSAQIKALSMIVAIEGLIPDRNADRRAGSAQNKSAPPPVHPQTGPAVAAADAPLDRPFSPPEATPSAPHAAVPASAPDNRVSSSIAKKPDTWRLRL
jgi:hypothetical protein